MLFIRNAFYFRKFFKEQIARESSSIDLNFVALYTQRKDGMRRVFKTHIRK